MDQPTPKQSDIETPKTDLPSADAVAHAFEGLTRKSASKSEPGNGVAAPEESGGGQEVGEDLAPKPHQMIDVDAELSAADAVPKEVQPVAPITPTIKVPRSPKKQSEASPASESHPPKTASKASGKAPFVAPTPFAEIPQVPSGVPIIHNQKTATPQPTPDVPKTQVLAEKKVDVPKEAPVPQKPQRAAERVDVGSAFVPNAVPPVQPVAKPAPATPAQTATTLPAEAAPTPASAGIKLNVPKQKISVLEQLRALAASPLHPLRTYKDDVESSVRDTKASVVTIAAAEQNRRAHTMPKAALAPTASLSPVRIALIVVAMLLVLAGTAALGYVFLKKEAPNARIEVAPSNLIYVDETKELPLSGLTHQRLTAELAALRDQTQLSLGLIREVYFTLPREGSQTGEKRLATAQETMRILAPNMPVELSRTLLPEFMLGAHVFDGNQGFIVLKIDSFEQAAAGLYAWEPRMRADLIPFMERRPRPRAANEPVQPTSTPRVIPTEFADRVLRNHDARVLLNQEGDIVLLYSFLDQRTVVITTNESTLVELASRVKNPPVEGL